jgi:DNA-binding transcriptional LysR family regulator
MIEVRQARYFLAVTETLHFGRAAERLHMSQPPLSQAILQLERQLGARLLDRSGRRVTLTETGRVFATECRAVLAAAQRAEDIAAQAEMGLAGTLRIGVVTAALSEPLLGALSGFQAARPQVELRVVEVDTPHGQRGLAEHTIDVAAIRLSAPTADLTVHPWRQDRFVLALPKHHPEASRQQPARLERFADNPWVWLNRVASPDYHDQLMATCHQAGFTPDVRHYANSITTQLAMVAGGLGITLVPDLSAGAAPLGTSYRRLASRNPLAELSLVTRSGADEPLVREFIRFALNERESTHV